MIHPAAHSRSPTVFLHKERPGTTGVAERKAGTWRFGVVQSAAENMRQLLQAAAFLPAVIPAA
jgi:hypothetical protein